MNPVSLRRASTEDHTLLMQLVAEFCEIDQHTFDPVRIGESLHPLLQHDDFGVIYLVEPALGYAVITWGYSLESGGREALIDEIYLRERGQGIGTQVLETLFNSLREIGIKKMFLETETHNARARRFYARSGFEADDSIWMSRDL